MSTKRNNTPPLNPFGPIESGREEYLGSAYANVDESVFSEAMSKRLSVDVQPARAFVGNIVSRRRYRVSIVVVMLVLSFFLLRAGWFQVVEGTDYRARADSNRTRTHVLPAERGTITDYRGVVLARNTPSFTLVARITELPDDVAARKLLYERVALVVGGDATQFEQAVTEAGNVPDALLLRDIPYSAALSYAVIDSDVVGIDLVLNDRRAYVTDSIPSLSGVLGYTAAISEDEFAREEGNGYVAYDRIGKQGVEKAYETLLRGTYGKEIFEVDSLGRYLRTIAKEDPVNGQRLTLAIDARLQAYIELALQSWLKGQDATRAAVVAMDPDSGELRALVSWPSYDANLFSAGIDAETYDALVNDPDRPLFPRAYAGEYPSGSTIKPLYAAAALTEGIITPSTSFVSVGGLQIGNRFFPDWRGGGHGVTNVYWAIADSVNTFFYTIGGGYDTFQGLGIDRLMAWCASFGFGAQSGLDLPGEADGFLPSKAWKEAEKGEPWYIGDTYNVSIGQGDMLVTPVQIARMTAVFANGGVLVTPHVIAATDLPTARVVTEEITDVVRNAMRQTITVGSATSLQSVPVAVAGKTGTAQWSKSSPPHSWFTGFAPFDDPSLVITVIVEDGGNQSLAIPITRDILTWYFSQTDIASD